MLKNNLLVAWRNLSRHKTYSLINVFGVSSGLAFNWLFRFEGSNQRQDRDEWPQYNVGTDFIEFMGIDVLQGRSFSEDFPSDTASFILNETAVVQLAARNGDHWNDPLGRNIEFLRTRDGVPQIVKNGPVIGVVQDFTSGVSNTKFSRSSCTTNRNVLGAWFFDSKQVKYQKPWHSSRVAGRILVTIVRSITNFWMIDSQEIM